MTLDEIEKKIDIDKQLEKCLKCPCLKNGEMVGCYVCDHFGKDCAEHDCGEGHINHKDKLALCCSDDCALTWAAIKMIAKESDGGEIDVHIRD